MSLTMYERHLLARLAAADELIAKLRHKLAPLADPEFTKEVAGRLEKTALLGFKMHLRRGDYIVLEPSTAWIALFPETPRFRMHDLRRLGQSLQALLWEKSKLNGYVVYVLPLEEYNEWKNNAQGA